MTIRTPSLLALLLPILACDAAARVPTSVPSTASAQDPVPAPAPVPAPIFDVIHEPWNAILARRVSGGDFEYAGLLKERAPLDAYIKSLEGVQLDAFAKLSRAEQFAFWVNAYNAYTVKRVLDDYPVKSIRDLGDEKLSVWDRDLVPLGALSPTLDKPKLTLNDIENKILRPTFQDARLHAAINCASKGCPPLRAEAFTGAKLDTQLDEQVKAWLADPSRNRFDAKKKRAEISKVFEWFAEDFQKEAGSAAVWIARFRPSDKAWLIAREKPTISFLEYDWALNEAKP